MTSRETPPESLGEQAANSIRIALQNVSTTMTNDQLYTTPLQVQSPTELALAIANFIKSKAHDTSQMIKAINLAAELHSPDLRYGEHDGNKAYIIHPLRNALRLIRFGARDESLLIATVLHDTVEDHPFELAAKSGVQTDDESTARRASLEHLSSLFGHDTASIVEGMSNPVVSAEEKSSMSREDWNAIYAEHVRTATAADSRVFVCKVSDFIDNAGGLGLEEDGLSPERQLRMAKKYLPVCDILLQRLERLVQEADVPISSHGTTEVRRLLELTQDRLGAVVNS